MKPSSDVERNFLFGCSYIASGKKAFFHILKMIFFKYFIIFYDQEKMLMMEILYQYSFFIYAMFIQSYKKAKKQRYCGSSSFYLFQSIWCNYLFIYLYI